MEQKITTALLKKFLEGLCTPQEQALVLAWLEKPGSEEALHKIMTDTWKDNMENSVEENPFDPEMNRWKERIRRLTNETAEEKQIHALTNKSKPFFLKYAAVWAAIILGISIFWFFSSKKNHELSVIVMVEKHNPYGQRSQLLLPDSSTIYLGAGSTIRFPEKFQGSTREIFLEGEAFFEVVPNPAKPFIVHTADVQTRVLGTSFKIEAFKGHLINVSVATGKVGVGHIDHTTSKLKPLAVLLPGQNISWNAATQDAVATSFPVDELEQWKQGKLVFRHSTLAHMAEELERWYKVKFKINNPEKANERISGVIPPTISVKQAMDVLSVTGHFKYSIRDDIINIY